MIELRNARYCVDRSGLSVSDECRPCEAIDRAVRPVTCRSRQQPRCVESVPITSTILGRLSRTRASSACRRPSDAQRTHCRAYQVTAGRRHEKMRICSRRLLLAGRRGSACTDVPGAAAVTCTDAGNSVADCRDGFFRTAVPRHGHVHRLYSCRQFDRWVVTCDRQRTAEHCAAMILQDSRRGCQRQ